VPGAIGWVDEPGDGVVGPRVRIRGWALASSGILAVELRFERQVFPAQIGLPRHDVAEVRPGYPDNPFSGFEIEADMSGFPAPPHVDRRRFSIVAIARDGSETPLGERMLVEPLVHARWRFAAAPDAPSFWLIPALSGIAAGTAHGLETQYSAYASTTTRIGMRVPILYLRTTTGASDDYRFDPDFDVTRRCGARIVAEDSLAQVLADSVARRLPVLVTLNGGIWADASGTAPEWDINDLLEENPANCQWNERDEVVPDDYLTHLPGSQEAPELARALTLNVHARDARRYKKRNLQQAATRLVDFMRAHPELLIGVNLDPDVYINPFFSETQWYDYNPGTLAQFRQWLAGSGPYAGALDDDAPDLAAYRRKAPLSLEQVRAIARRPFAAWSDVDPPRAFSRDPAHPFWNDPWVREWETFRRHLVALHYDELAQWLVEAGMPRERIWSSQGLMAPADGCLPLAHSITSPVKNYDSAGVSIEGSKPRDGHLGAIVYGAAATNEVAMEHGGTLYAALAAIDPGYAIVEFNTADLHRPGQRPTYADAYRALRDLWNTGARFVSPMAWNGSNGRLENDPAYVTFTAWRNTPLEDATRDFLLARSGLPLGSILWTFGSQGHADDDGWTTRAGRFVSEPGALRLAPDAARRVALVSPGGLALDPGRIRLLVLGLPPDHGIRFVGVAARTGAHAAWIPLVDVRRASLTDVEAGVAMCCTPPAIPHRIDQIEIVITFDAQATVMLTRIAVLRRAEPGAAESP
jgi:hypothetical protein